MTVALYAAPLYPPGIQLCDNAGNPLAAGRVTVQLAGTSVNTNSYPTYTDALNDTNPNANPVILDGFGRAVTPQVWLQAPRLYKVTVQDAALNVIQVMDNYSPAVATPAPGQSEWVRELSGTGLSFLSATQFKVLGADVRTTWSKARRFQAQVTAGLVSGTIYNSTFGGGDTTITVKCDVGQALDAGLSQAYYALLSGPYFLGHQSFGDPKGWAQVTLNANQAITTGADRKVQCDVKYVDLLAEYDNTVNFRYTPYYTGGASAPPQTYLVLVSLKLLGAIASAQIALFKQGIEFSRQIVNTNLANGTMFAAFLVDATNTADFFEVFVNVPTNTSLVNGTNGTTINYIRMS